MYVLHWWIDPFICDEAADAKRSERKISNFKVHIPKQKPLKILIGMQLIPQINESTFNKIFVKPRQNAEPTPMKYDRIVVT